jgi:hypothetical protein
MKKYILGFWFSMPVQLVFLHCKRYQILLLFWYILFATVAGSFMKTYGANALFLAPEYYEKVTAFSTAIVGFSIGIFIMSWNITTFILHTKQFKFLATTAQPFLKYCINNAVIPISFLLFYLYKIVEFTSAQEFLSFWSIFLLLLGFIGGFCLSIFLAFVYFFGADKTIYYSMGKVITEANASYIQTNATTPSNKRPIDEIRIDWFFSARMAIRQPRNVQHYDNSFLEAIFKRHHFAVVVAIVAAFLVLILLGFNAQAKLFQIPAAASVTVLFAILIAVSGALSIFFGNKTLPILLVIYLVLNVLYQKNIIDPRNKAYGLNYNNKESHPTYSKANLLALANTENKENDKAYYLSILNNWKAKQRDSKPIMYVISVSGGGLRSANFTMQVLQKLNELSNGSLLHQTSLINGASGGMLGATYFRELFYKQQQNKKLELNDANYTEDISKDLLNPLFSSFVCQDLLGPIQKFSFNNQQYIKDRGYAFEQKLDLNTHGFLRKSIEDYKKPEFEATIPLLFFNSVVTQDARKMFIAAHPARFLMQQNHTQNALTQNDVDAIDFTSFFEKQQSNKVSILSALRMNATFPYALPNTALPTQPVIDVMDAGLRDNYGQETALRFLDVFKDWLQANTSKVILLKIRDRDVENWSHENEQQKQYSSLLTQPFLVLQNNWYRLQNYAQQDALEYFAKSYGNNFKVINWQYEPTKINHAAALSFHLTTSEKNDIKQSLQNAFNKASFETFLKER